MSGALRQAQSVNREKKAGKLAQYAAQSDMQGELSRISSEEEAYLNMSPIDRLKLNMPSNGAPVGDDKQAANTYQNTHDALSVLPWAGSAVAMKDAWDDSGRGAQALGEGRYMDAAGNYTGMLSNALGAVLPFHLPNTPAARQAAQDAPTQANIFAGPAAKTADHAALAKAQEMAEAGVGRDAIHAQTGWHQGIDGKWRFEIDDSAAKLTGLAPNANGGQQFSGLAHGELSNAYGDIPPVAGRIGGGFSGSNFEGRIIANGRDEGQAGGAALHEVQHTIQDLEGFAKGTSAGYIAMAHPEELAPSPALLQIDGRLRRATPGTPEYNDLIQKKIRAQDEAGFAPYFRTAGEVEARNVMARKDMTAAERRAKAPWETQDVPDEQQIVRLR